VLALVAVGIALVPLLGRPASVEGTSPERGRPEATDPSAEDPASRAQALLEAEAFLDAARQFDEAASGAAHARERVLHLCNAAVCLERAARSGAGEARLARAAREAMQLSDSDPDAAFVLANWARWQLDQGRWEEAEAFALQAIRRARSAKEPATRVRGWRIVAESRRLLRRFGEAEEAVRTARGLLRDSDLSPGLDPVARELDLTAGLLELDRGRPGAALLDLEAILRAVEGEGDEGVRRRALLGMAEAASRDDRPGLREMALQRAAELAREARERADVHQCRALVATIEGRHEDAAAEAERCLAEAEAWIHRAPDESERIARRRGARGYLEAALATADASTVTGDRARTALAWIRRIRDGISSNPPQETRHPVTSSEPRLDAGDVHVLWFWGARRVTGILGRPGEDGRTVYRRFDAGPSEDLREWILLFRSLLGNAGQEELRLRAGELLARSLLPGGEAGQGGRLVLEPDGPLTALPFSALPGVRTEGDVDRAPLGIRCALLRWLPGVPASRGPVSAPSSDLVILADPSLPESGGHDELPGARREAERIAREDPRAVVLLGPEATESRVIGSGGAAVLHVAAHTSFRPETSALLLAPGDGEDGRLTPEEIRHLPTVPGLVVLSICESPLADVSGRTSAGALGHAFLRAGAATVIGALWKVEDDHLPTFLAEVYRRLREGVTPSEALRGARETMVRSGDPHLAVPLLWGAFVAEGRDEPPRWLPRRREKGADPMAAVLGLTAAIGFLAALGARRILRRAA
jgi:tetratricopeptide (TPR) repeat protein